MPTQEVLASDLVGSTLNVQRIVQINLKSYSNGKKKHILELDIKECFDRMNHHKLISIVRLTHKLKRFLQLALKLDVLSKLLETVEGSTQCSVISSLLCKIGLYEIEDLWNEQFRKNKVLQQSLRYADNMIFFIKSGENAQVLRI